MFSGFKKFVFRGNVVDLAVGVVFGAAFSGLVNALVKDLITPLIAAIMGQPDFSGLLFTINGSRFMYGEFLNSLISFFLVAVAVYFFVVAPLNSILARTKKQEIVAPTTKKCPECISDVPVEATRCAYCAIKIE